MSISLALPMDRTRANSFGLGRHPFEPRFFLGLGFTWNRLARVVIAFGSLDRTPNTCNRTLQGTAYFEAFAPQSLSFHGFAVHHPTLPFAQRWIVDSGPWSGLIRTPSVSSLSGMLDCHIYFNLLLICAYKF